MKNNRRIVRMVLALVLGAPVATVCVYLLWGYFVLRPLQMCSATDCYWDRENQMCEYMAAECHGTPEELPVEPPDQYMKCQITWEELQRSFEKREKVHVRMETLD